MRYGVIGAGMMGQEHIRNLALIEGASVVAIADPDDTMRARSAQEAIDQKAAGDAKPATYTDYRQLLDDDVCDAYVIASPNDTHIDVMQDVLATPSAILCEKPLCTTVDDCERLIQLDSQRVGGPIWVAMEYRYMAPIARLIHEVNSGVAGPVKMLSIREHRFPFLPKVGDWNRFNQRTGGTLTEKCCHFWDLMRLVLQANPTRVYASAAADVNHKDERYEGKTPDIIDNAYVIVDFDSGARGLLDLCMFAEGSFWQETIAATGPCARIEAFVPAIAKQDNDSEVAIADRVNQSETRYVVKEDPALLRAGSHYGSTFHQHQRFFDLVLTGQGEPEVTLEDGLWSVRVGQAAEESARTHQPVEILT